MKHKNLSSILLAFLLSFCLGFASVGCLLTGYGLRADPLALALACALVSAVLTAILTSRYWSWISVALLSAFVLVVLFHEDFQQQLVSLIDVVCKIFAKAYDLSAPIFLLRSKYIGHMLPLLAFHGIISYTCAYILLNRQSVFMTAVPAILILGLCFLTLDSMPALPYLMLWLFTFMLILITHTVRRQDPIQGNRLTRLLALPVAASLLLTLVLVPADGRNVPDLDSLNVDALWEWFLGNRHSGSNNSSQDGDGENDLALNEQLSLKDLAPREPEGTEVMKVTSDFGGTIYLRAQDFDEYTGTAWNATADRTENDLKIPAMWVIRNGNVTVEPVQPQKHLYLPCYPDAAPTITGGMVIDESSPEKYTFSVTNLQHGWEKQWRAGNRIPSVTVDARYLSLPTQTVTGVQSILRELDIQNAADQLVIAERIGDYVRHCATYDRGTNSMPSDETDFAIWFLTEAETGYCIHYASAATVLLRAAGIPARYVEGYTAKAIRNVPMTIRDTQAHAWVEYYLDGAGWIILDPTSSSSEPVRPTAPTGPTRPTPVPGTTVPTTVPTTPNTTDPTSQPTTQTTTMPTQPGTTTHPSVIPTTPSGNGVGIGDGDGSGTDIAWLKPLLIPFGAGFSLCLAFILQYRIRRTLKKRKLRRGDPNTQALSRYKEALRLSKLSGLPMPEALTALAEKAKFSQHTLTDAELAEFDTFFNDCAAAMKQKKLLRRFYLCFLRAAY